MKQRYSSKELVSPPGIKKKLPLEDKTNDKYNELSAIVVNTKPSRKEVRDQKRGTGQYYLTDEAKEGRLKKKNTGTGSGEAKHSTCTLELPGDNNGGTNAHTNGKAVKNNKKLLAKEPEQPYADNITWRKNVALTKVKLHTAPRPLLAVAKKSDTTKRKVPDKKHQVRVQQALGDILVERILDTDPSLLQTVSAEDWETLLAMPVHVLQHMMVCIEYHEERGLVFGWKGVQIMVLSHTLGLEHYSMDLLE